MNFQEFKNQDNSLHKKYALDGSELGFALQKVLTNNPDINNLSTNKLSNLTDEELCLLFERYNVVRTSDRMLDCRNLFLNIVQN